MWDVQAVLLIIAAIAAGLKLIIDAFYTGKKLTIIETNQATNQALNTIKLDTIHEATNGGMSDLKKQLEAARLEISELKKAGLIFLFALLIPASLSAQSTAIDPDLAWHNGQKVADIISYATTGTAIGIDIFHAARSDNPKRALARIGIKDGSIIGISELVKAVIHRTRPDKSDNKSFYSEHTALSFSCAGKCLYFGVSTAYLRTAANKHFLTDVLVGAGVGLGMNAVMEKVK